MINFKVIWQTKKSFTTPKELKGIKPFAKINFERDGIKSAYIDNNGDLWYKDNMVIISNTKPIVEHDELYGDTIDIKYLKTKQFVKFENIHKYIDLHFLDILRMMCNASESYYTDNTISDNLRLERLYEQLLKKYLKEIKARS